MLLLTHRLGKPQICYHQIIRIYGKDQDGIATCVHIHGVYPYFYVLYESDSIPVLEYCQKLHNAIDEALAVAYRRQQPFVHCIKPTEGTSIYGFREKTQTFLRIELTNHVFVHKCADLLVNGNIMEKLQPFESHIPYLLHFMADYSLTGCGWIHFEKYEQTTNISELRDLDIHCGAIYSSQNEGSQLNIDSLQELQIQDANIRRGLGVDLYTMTLGEPEEKDIKWDKHEIMMDDLSRRLEEIEADPESIPLSQVYSLPNVSSRPSGSVPSQQSSQLLPYKETQLRTLSLEEELSLTAKITRHDQAQRKASSEKATPSKEYETDNLLHVNSVREISNHCNTKLDGQFTKILMAPAPLSSEVDKTVGGQVPPTPFYGNPDDIPFFPFTHGGKEYKLKGQRPCDLPSFRFSSDFIINPLQAYLNDFENVPAHPERVFQLGELPPPKDEVVEWHIKSQSQETKAPVYAMPSLPNIAASDELTLMCLEVFTTVRENQTPIAETDPIEAVIWQMGKESGVITTRHLGNATVVENELELIDALVQLVKKLDPDILTGYEAVAFSWGYIAERFTELTDDILDIGRLKPGNAFTRVDPILHPGRYLINLWYILRHEINLPKYTLEVAIEHTFHHPTPHYSFDTLYKLWNTEPKEVISYFATRIRLTLQLIDHLELISKYSEQARIIGIDFYSAMTRGSQFQVESVLCRLSKRRGFRLLSPSRTQVGQQAALERIPLVMEPQSNLYTDPVCVLDFRSLYPSIIIAFNLCFSTCIGRLQLWKGKNKLGVLSDLKVPKGLKKEDIFVGPNGIGYVKPHVRKSILATMLKEILESRFMIKNSMKFNKSDLRYQRNMNSKQTALKFIANVTYGYVSASFTGRMPCAEIADTIVSTGRELLVQSIKIIESQMQWGIKPKVVYGDTDSLFVRLPGVSQDQAFIIGNELARIVTAAFPSPIELEMEKVYNPCILLTKKRYVGLSYDSPAATAKFDAKGTETIRRDGTPIESRLELGALQLLFKDADLSEVKSYLQKEWRGVLEGTINLKEFCFSQKVKLGHYRANPSNLPPGAVVSLKRAAVDKGSAPQYNERVSFIIKNGLGNLNERAVLPEDFVHDPSISLDSQYYILKNIVPPLERLFNIFGADVRSWFTEMPKSNRTNQAMYKAQCYVCHGRSDKPLCASCRANDAESLYILHLRDNMQRKALQKIERKCIDCSGKLGCRFCNSQDCEVYYDRERARSEIKALTKETEKTQEYLASLDF